MTRKSAGFLIAAVILCGASLRFLDLEVKKRTPDEKVYAGYASEIAAHGLSNTINLIDAYRSEPSFWVYPPPTRIGYIYAQALALKLGAAPPEKAGAFVSVFFSVVLLAVTAVIGWRFFGPRVSFFSVLFLSVSPLDLALARRAWPDSALAFAAALLLYSFFAIVRRKETLFSLIVFLLSGVYAMLVKETGFGVFALFAAVLCAVLTAQSRRRAAMFAAAGALLAVESVVLMLKKAAGGVLSVAELWRLVGRSIASNPYAADLQRVAPGEFCLAFLSLSPVSAVFFLIGALIAVRKKAAYAAATAAFFLCFFAAILASPYFHNFRYLSPAMASYCLTAGFAAAFILDSLRGKKTVWLFIAVLALSLAWDHTHYREVFVEKGVLDLTPVAILKPSSAR